MTSHEGSESDDGEEALKQACHRLYVHLGCPDNLASGRFWVTAIGARWPDEIVVYTRYEVGRCPTECIGDTWEGFKVIYHHFGDFATIGEVE